MSINSSYWKLEQARRHVSNLEKSIGSFLNSSPFKTGTTVDAETKRRKYLIISAEDVPIEIALIAGDVFQNLRSALDHLAYGLCSGSRRSKDRIYFPIADSKARYEEKKAEWTKGMSREAKTRIDELKPYKGGNDILWRLRELNNIDKHRLLVTVESYLHSIDIGAFMVQSFPDLSVFEGKASAWVTRTDPLLPLKVGDVLFGDAPNAKEKAIPFNRCSSQRARNNFGSVFDEVGSGNG